MAQIAQMKETDTHQTGICVICDICG